ncbi:unnamed protein product [Rhodiola kirilowii]
MGIALYKLWAFTAKFLNPSFIKKGDGKKMQQGI